MNKGRGSENKAVLQEAGNLVSLGASWEPEPAISLMQETNRDLEMRFL